MERLAILLIGVAVALAFLPPVAREAADHIGAATATLRPAPFKISD